MRYLKLLLLMSLLLTACGVDPTSQTDSLEETAVPTTQFTDLIVQPRTVVIDTDMAFDDWMAILFMLNIPEMDIRAITVTGAGEAHCEPGMRHAFELVDMSGADEIPVACGRETSLQGGHTSPEATFIFDLLTGMYGFIKSGGYYFWDPLAAAVMVDESLATLQTRRIMIVEDEGPESGRTKSVDDGFEVIVAVSADGPRFEDIFLDTINAQSH